MKAIEEMFQYYLDHQDELVKIYDEKYLVITKDGVDSSFDTELEAYFYAEKELGFGNFIIQLCTEGTGAYTHRFHSRVEFAS